MIELEILRGIAVLYALSKFVVSALIIGAILEDMDKKKQKKAKRQLEKRRAYHKLDCEIVGRKILN